jgi:hypothetical protein
MTWYTNAIKAKWNNPKVQRAILFILEDEAENLEGLSAVEDSVFGPRVECPWDCGSMLLVGVPECWGCDNGLTWKGRTVTKGKVATA